MHKETFELAIRVGEWHDKKINHLLDVIDGVREGVTLKIDDAETETVLTEEQAKFLKLGMVAIFNEFSELPFSIEGIPGNDLDELLDETLMVGDD